MDSDFYFLLPLLPLLSLLTLLLPLPLLTLSSPPYPSSSIKSKQLKEKQDNVEGEVGSGHLSAT